MAIQLKVSNTNSPILLDLTSGRTRKTVYSPPNFAVSPVTLGLLGIGAALLAPGIYRAFTGPSERAQAIERLKVEQLEAKLNHDQARTEKLNAEVEKIRLALSPTIEAERQQKIDVIHAKLPLDLWRTRIQNEALELELELNQEIAPTVARIKELTADNLVALTQQRWQAHEAALDLAQVNRERIEAEAEKVRASTEQTELQTRLLETAVDGMDFFSKQIFLRDRLFPERPEPRGFISPTGIRTITAF